MDINITYLVLLVLAAIAVWRIYSLYRRHPGRMTFSAPLKRGEAREWAKHFYNSSFYSEGSERIKYAEIYLELVCWSHDDDLNQVLDTCYDIFVVQESIERVDGATREKLLRMAQEINLISKKRTGKMYFKAETLRSIYA